jgi:hypothetical protein
MKPLETTHRGIAVLWRYLSDPWHRFSLRDARIRQLSIYGYVLTSYTHDIVPIPTQ